MPASRLAAGSARPRSFFTLAAGALLIALWLLTFNPTSKVQAISTTIVLSEVEYDPVQTGLEEPGHEWFELHNLTGSPVTLNGWTIRDNTTDDTIPTVTIPANGFLVVAATTAFLENYPEFDHPDAPIVYLNSRIGNGLNNNGDVLFLKDESGAVIDEVCWGDNTDAFDPPVPDVPPGHSIERYPPEVDTDTNADWRDQADPQPGNWTPPPTATATASATPTPTTTPTSTATNTATPASSPTATATPTATGAPTTTPTATATPTPGSAPTVTATASPTATATPAPAPSATATGTPGSTPTATATPASTPTATATVEPITGLAALVDSPAYFGRPAVFTATQSTGNHVTYTWDFGDGSALTTTAATTTTHTYLALGPHTAVLTATNPAGGRSAAATVEIVDVPIDGLTLSASPETLPATVTFTATIAAGTNVTYTWNFGDGSPELVIGPGDGPGAAGPQSVVVDHAYTDSGPFTTIVTASNTVSSLSSQRLAGAPALGAVYLPLVSTFQPGLPDLVGRLSLDPPLPAPGQPVTITAIVTNRGRAPAAHFWVDFYIDPNPVPSGPNQVWDQVCGRRPCYGIAWYVAQTIAPGDSLALTSSPDSYVAANTIWPGYLPPGTDDLYLFVDSWNPTVAEGAVVEEDEGNNLFGLTGLGLGGSSLPASGAAEKITLPPRWRSAPPSR